MLFLNYNITILAKNSFQSEQSRSAYCNTTCCQHTGSFCCTNWGYPSSSSKQIGTIMIYIVWSHHYLCDLWWPLPLAAGSLKAGSHEDEISNETSNGGVTLGPTVSAFIFHHNQTLLDRNDNVWDTSGSHWTTIKLNSCHWLPTNSPYYYIIKISNNYYQ